MEILQQVFTLEKSWGEIKNCARGFEITSFNK
jgi:hypothetical protein